MGAFSPGRAAITRAQRAVGAALIDKDPIQMTQEPGPWPQRRVWQPRRGERIETACAITSLTPKEANAEELLALWRGRRGSETRLHYVRDVTLGEDACRVRTGHAPRRRSPPCATRWSAWCA
jgi:hypothetical protein